MSNATQTSQARTRRAIFIALAFLLQGLWAFYVAREHGFATQLRSGLLHGTLCALATVASTLLMEVLYKLPNEPTAGFIFAICGTATVMIGGTSLIHLINGTPDILATIAPLVALGLPFYIFYSYLIMRADQQRRTT